MLCQRGMFQVMLLGTPASIIICLTFYALPPFASIVTAVRLEQLENAEDPMLVIESGTVTLARQLQPLNEVLKMLVMLNGTAATSFKVWLF